MTDTRCTAVYGSVSLDEEDVVRHSQPTDADKHIGDVIMLTNPNNEPSCCILNLTGDAG